MKENSSARKALILTDDLPTAGSGAANSSSLNGFACALSCHYKVDILTTNTEAVDLTHRRAGTSATPLYVTRDYTPIVLSRWVHRFIKFSAYFFRVDEIDFYGWMYRIFNNSIIDKMNSYDLLVIFWDSQFEWVLNYAAVKPDVFLYLAKPRYAAGRFRLDHSQSMNQFKKQIGTNYFNRQERLHLRRVSKARWVSNIALSDVKYYSEKGIRCSYVPQIIGVEAGVERLLHDDGSVNHREKLSVCLAMGSNNMLGSSEGLNFIAKKIFTEMSRRKKTDMFSFTCVGTASFPDEFSRLIRSGVVRYEGFVENFSSYLASVDCFIFANNVSEYRGAYTRIPTCMSYGLVVLAHQRLSDELPGLENGENIFLFKDPSEAVDILESLVYRRVVLEKVSANAKQWFRKYASISAGAHFINKATDASVNANFVCY